MHLTLGFLSAGFIACCPSHVLMDASSLFPHLFLTWDIEVSHSESLQLQLSKPQAFPFFLGESPFAGVLDFTSKAPYSLATAFPSLSHLSLCPPSPIACGPFSSP